MLLPTDWRLHGPLWPARMLTCSRVVSYHSHQRLHLHRTHWLSPLTVHCMCSGACLPARRCSAGLTPLPSGRVANCISYTKRIVHRPSSNCGLFVPCSLFKINSQGPDPSTQKKIARDRTPVPKKKKKGRAKKTRIQCFCFSLLTREFSYEGLCRYHNESWHDDFGLGLTGLLRWTIAVWWCGQHVSSWCRWSELTG